MIKLYDIFPRSDYYFKLIKNNICEIIFIMQHKVMKMKIILRLRPSHHTLSDFTVGLSPHIADNDLLNKSNLDSHPNNFYYDIIVFPYTKRSTETKQWIHDTPKLYKQIKEIIIPEYHKSEEIEKKFIYELIKHISDPSKIMEPKYIIFSIIYKLQQIHNFNVKQMINFLNKYMNKHRIFVIDTTTIKKIINKMKKYCYNDVNKIKLCEKSIDDFQEHVLAQEQGSEAISPHIANDIKIEHETVVDNDFIFRYTYQNDNFKINLIGTPDPIKMTANLHYLNDHRDIANIHYNFWIISTQKETSQRETSQGETSQAAKLIPQGEISTLRDLRGFHINFLKDLRQQFIIFIENKYKIYIEKNVNFDNNPIKLRMIVVYPQNSIWRFFIDATISKFLADDPFYMRDRIHTIDSIICNLEYDSEYYAKMNFDYLIPIWHPITKLVMQKAGNQDVNNEWNNYVTNKLGWKDIELAHKECGEIRLFDKQKHDMISITLKHYTTSYTDFIFNEMVIKQNFYTGNHLYFLGYIPKSIYTHQIKLIKNVSLAKNELEYFDNYNSISFIETHLIRQKMYDMLSKMNDVDFIKDDEDINKQSYGKYYKDFDDFFIRINPGRLPPEFDVNNVNNDNKDNDNIFNTETIFFVAWWKSKSLKRTDERFLFNITRLNGTNLPMLINMRKEILNMMLTEYDVNPSIVDMFFHYPSTPNYSRLHLHVIFNKQAKYYLHTRFDRHQRIFSLNHIINLLTIYPNYFNTVKIPIMIQQKDFNEIYGSIIK